MHPKGSFFSKAARRKTETRVWYGRIMAAGSYTIWVFTDAFGC